MKVRDVLVLGAGSAGLMAALTLKRRLPHLSVRVVRSPEIGVIGVGEGTTPSFPQHFFDYLKLKPQSFYELAEPTWKLGIRFLWGPRDHYHYTFFYEFQNRLAELPRNSGYFYGPDEKWVGPHSALLTHNKAFPRRADGMPHFHNRHAFHIENLKLVRWLETTSRALGVEILDATVTAEAGPEGIAALVTAEGTRLTADLYLDASGFRSELLGKTLGVPFLSYADSLFCDRAVIAGWPRTSEPILACTEVETMDAGWCWRIEHEHFINRGYVYSSAFISDEDALAEFLRKNPQVTNTPRVVRYRSGRYERNWKGNVVGIGNAVGFVEPLEATALQVICVECSTLADSLIDSLCDPTPSLIELYNRFNTQAWDDIRDFLSIHYKFNTRRETPFWKACRADTKLHGAEPLVRFYQENGPSIVAGVQLLHPSNAFGMDGYLAMLVGQNVPHDRPYAPTEAEARRWREYSLKWEAEARRGMTVRECLDALRGRGRPAAWIAPST